MVTTYPDGTTPSIVIIGAGVSGICMGIQLKEQLGLTSFKIYDLESDIGGTWFSNIYPGCACDVPSHLYSYSFAKKPDWSQHYPSQPELYKYFKGIVDRYDLMQYIQFRSVVTSAVWSEKDQIWNLVIQKFDDNGKYTEEHVSANIVVSAVGALRVPNVPSIFKDVKEGIVHTAKWDKNIELEGKRVAIVGSGASAVQVIPAIVNKVKHLTVLQRTPTWVIPRRNFIYPEYMKTLFKYVPGLATAWRCFIFTRNEIFHQAFKRGSFMSSIVSAAALKLANYHIESQLGDPELLKVLKPNYGVGCKRIVVSDEYYPAFKKENVDIITDPIDRVEDHTIVTTHIEDGKQVERRTEVDVIILATGFQILKVDNLNIIDKRGKSIWETWLSDDGPKTYYGITAPDLPNYFILLGPNTGLGHSSIIFMIECQVNYIIQAIREMMQKNLATLEVKEEYQNKFAVENDKKLESTVWTGGECSSWYMNQNRKVIALWAENCTSYWRQTRQFELDAYRCTSRSSSKKTQ